MLEKRVTNVLSMKRSLIYEKASQRKSSFLSILILITIVMIIAGSCATGKKIISTDDAMKQFEGVYLNTDYEGYIDLYPQKRIIFSNGKMESYNKANRGSPSFKCEYMIEESWSDSTGNIYSTVYVKWTPASITSFELWKLDKTGNTLEINSNYFYLGEDVSDEYPTKIDPNSETYPKLIYYIWYRQK